MTSFLEVMRKKRSSSSPQLFAENAPSRGQHSENTGLPQCQLFTKKSKSLEPALAPAWSRCGSDHSRESPNRYLGNRRPSETMMAMSFIARQIEIFRGVLDNEFTDRITLTVRSHSFQE